MRKDTNATKAAGCVLHHLQRLRFDLLCCLKSKGSCGLLYSISDAQCMQVCILLIATLSHVSFNVGRRRGPMDSRNGGPCFALTCNIMQCLIRLSSVPNTPVLARGDRPGKTSHSKHAAKALAAAGRSAGPETASTSPAPAKGKGVPPPTTCR